MTEGNKPGASEVDQRGLDLEYLKWASEQLATELSKEDERQRRLEQKAVAWAAITLGLVGAVLRFSAPPVNFAWAYWALIAISFALVACSVFKVINAVRIRSYKGVSPEIYAGDPILEESDVGHRYYSILKHQREVLTQVRIQLNKLAVAVAHTQTLAILTIVALVGALALGLRSNIDVTKEKEAYRSQTCDCQEALQEGRKEGSWEGEIQKEGRPQVKAD